MGYSIREDAQFTPTLLFFGRHRQKALAPWGQYPAYDMPAALGLANDFGHTRGHEVLPRPEVPGQRESRIVPAEVGGVLATTPRRALPRLLMMHLLDAWRSTADCGDCHGTLCGVVELVPTNAWRHSYGNTPSTARVGYKHVRLSSAESRPHDPQQGSRADHHPPPVPRCAAEHTRSNCSAILRSSGTIQGRRYAAAMAGYRGRRPIHNHTSADVVTDTHGVGVS
jgi:hypothetical protein